MKNIIEIIAMTYVGLAFLGLNFFVYKLLAEIIKDYRNEKRNKSQNSSKWQQ